MGERMRRLTMSCGLGALVLPAFLMGCPAGGEESMQVQRSSGAAPLEFAEDAVSAGLRVSAEVRVETIAEGLEHPWGIAFLPGDEGFLVTERPGRLRLVRDGRLDPLPIAGLPEIRGQGEGGLLDVALHPRFEENRLVYVAYSKPGDLGGTTAVARGRLVERRLLDLEDVFVADAWGQAAVNYGGRLLFDRDGYLFVTIGDRREEARARDLRDHAGTTLRLHEDGRVPADNPFVGRSDARDEIYSYGHRNPQGLVLHPRTGEIWMSDHGARGGDWINRLVAAADYGWPAVSFGDHYDGRRIPDPARGQVTEMPIHYWNPGVSPSGLTIYDGDLFPGWRGQLLSGSLVARSLIRLDVREGRVIEEERLLSERGERIRTVATASDGSVIILIDAPRAPVLRLVPAGQG
jgi:aldose sugar dehydrogenase